MRTHILTLSAVIAVLSFSATAEITHDPKAKQTATEDTINKHFSSAPISQSFNHLRHINTTINGKPFAMIIDSGADSIVLAKSLADTLKIPLKESGTAQSIGTAAGKVYEGKLDSFRVGKEFNFGSPTVHFLDLSNVGPIKLPNGTTIPNGGQLGLGFLNASASAIDYPNNRFLVQKQPLEGGISSIYKQLGDSSAPMVEDSSRRHYVEATVKGQQVYFLVDTGAATNVLYDTAAESLGLTVLKHQGKVTSVSRKNAAAKMTVLEALKIGDLKIGGKISVLVLPHSDELQKLNDKPIVGILGGSLFEALKATIDFASDTITMAITRKK